MQRPFLSTEVEVAEFLSELQKSRMTSETISSNVNSSNDKRFYSSEPAVSETSFLSRVSNIPVFNATLKTINEVYETGKMKSSVLRVPINRLFDYGSGWWLVFCRNHGVFCQKLP